MLGEDEFFECAEVALDRFEHDEDLVALFEFALPPVVRFDGGDEIRAGDEPGFQRGASEGAGGLAVGRGDEDQGEEPCSFHVRWCEGRLSTAWRRCERLVGQDAASEQPQFTFYALRFTSPLTSVHRTTSRIPPGCSRRDLAARCCVRSSATHPAHRRDASCGQT